MATAAELAGATTAQVAEARAALAAHLASYYPELPLAAGQLADLVLAPSGDALAAIEVYAAAKAASYDPETALAEGGYDEDTLTSVLAGRGVTRGESSRATGSVAIIFATNTTIAVPQTLRLATADGVYYRPTTGITARPTTTTTITSTEVRLIALPGGGGYAAVVPVTAEAVGVTGNRIAGTALIAASALANQTGAFAATDLTGGADTETDTALLARLPAATAPQGAGTVTGITGLIQAAAPDVTAVAVLGYNSAGLTRARSTLAAKSPGKADARIRTAGLGRSAVRLEATYIGLDGSYGSWRIVFTGDEATDWVYVERLVQADANPSTGGYTPTTTLTFDTSSDSTAPDIRTVLDASFSIYAGGIVTFTDPDTSTVGLTINVSTREYDMVVRTTPGITEAQAAVSAADDRPVGGDCLVRTACPVSVSVTAAATSTATVTSAQVAVAVAAAVNAMGITPTLSGSVVAADAVSRLPTGTTLTLSTWIGSVRAADGVASTINGTDGLAVTTDWSAGLGPDTVAYFCDSGNVTVNLT